MKKSYKIILIVLLVFLSTTGIMAQTPPPPPPDHGSTGNQPGGNAPIAGGLFILLGLGAAYGGRKLYKITQEQQEK